MRVVGTGRVEPAPVLVYRVGEGGTVYVTVTVIVVIGCVGAGGHQGQRVVVGRRTVRVGLPRTCRLLLLLIVTVRLPDPLETYAEVEESMGEVVVSQSSVLEDVGFGVEVEGLDVVVGGSVDLVELELEIFEELVILEEVVLIELVLVDVG